MRARIKCGLGRRKKTKTPPPDWVGGWANVFNRAARAGGDREGRKEGREGCG